MQCTKIYCMILYACSMGTTCNTYAHCTCTHSYQLCRMTPGRLQPQQRHPEVLGNLSSLSELSSEGKSPTLCAEKDRQLHSVTQLWHVVLQTYMLHLHRLPARRGVVHHIPPCGWGRLGATMTSHSLLGNQFWVSSCFIHLEAVHFSTTLLMGHLAI